jgi:hypothetical protein
MMEFKEDITYRINLDFSDSAERVIGILSDAISKTNYLKTDRIIRCIIYLSKGDLDKLKHNIEIAISDPRDVMLYAEYENLDDKDFKYKRVRDFNKTFEKCTENVKE